MPVCVISQPRFFPGLHFLHRMMVADMFVIFDTVQFTPRHEENRARLKSAQGPQWLTVPMRQLNREQPILETYVDDTQPWQSKAIKTLSSLYGKARHYPAYAPEIVSILEAPYQTLTQLNRATWAPALRLLGISCSFVCASELPVSGRGPQLLLATCKYLGADIYLSGAFGREYLDIAEFARAGIEVRFHKYTYPAYPQRFGDFVPFLSYLDMLFNAGLERDKVLIGGEMLVAG